MTSATGREPTPMAVAASKWVSSGTTSEMGKGRFRGQLAELFILVDG